METFIQLFGSLLSLVYHCFDRLVILAYLPLLTRAEHVVYLFRDVNGISPITPEVLRQRTRTVPTLGGVLRLVSRPSDRMGRERGEQRRPGAAVSTAPGTEKPVRRVLHLPQHGNRAHLPLQHPQVSDRRPRLPHPAPAT